MKNKIKELRAERRMTQDQLAARLDVSRQTIISLERERYNPSINLAFKIAHVFQCSIEDIFIYEEDNE
jgi:putative transcriptional regulator